MDGLILCGLFYLALGVIWVLYIAPKQARERRARMQEHLGEEGYSPGDTSADEDVDDTVDEVETTPIP